MTLTEFKEKVQWMKDRERETHSFIRENQGAAGFTIILTQVLQMSERIIAIEEKLNVIGVRNFPADWRQD